jgi:hypothetical protein
MINIERVRSLIDFVALTSHRQRAKVGVIVPAERMNVAAPTRYEDARRAARHPI